jgi:hypothetical protein
MFYLSPYQAEANQAWPLVCTASPSTRVPDSNPLFLLILKQLIEADCSGTICSHEAYVICVRSANSTRLASATEEVSCLHCHLAVGPEFVIVSKFHFDSKHISRCCLFILVTCVCIYVTNFIGILLSPNGKSVYSTFCLILWSAATSPTAVCGVMPKHIYAALSAINPFYVLFTPRGAEWSKGQPCPFVYLVFKESLRAARSKALDVLARSDTGTVGSNPNRGVDVCPRLFCCHCFPMYVTVKRQGWFPSKESYRLFIMFKLSNEFWVVGWYRPAKDKAHFWALANTVMNLLGPGGIFLTIWATVSFCVALISLVYGDIVMRLAYLCSN